MDKLKKLIDEIIIGYRQDMKFIQEIRRNFAQKGLDTNIPSMLFKNQMEVEDLKINELICLTEFLYTELNQERFSLKKYFSDMEISNYKVYQQPNKETQTNNIVHIEEVRMITDIEYVVPMTAKQLTELRQNRQYAYFKDIQRCTKKEKLPNGDIIEKINVNKQGIESLKSRFKDKERYIVPTEISFTILDIENKNPQYQFIPQYKNTGDLNIKINFDIDSDEYTPLIINDGYHRLTAITDAYLEDNSIADKQLVVGIHVLTEVQAKDLTADTFKQNATDKQWIDSLKFTKENQIIDMLIQKSVFLSENDIVNSKRDFVRDTKAITYRVLLKQGIKLLNLTFNNDITMTRNVTKIAKNLDILLNYLKDEYRELFHRDCLLFEKAFIMFLAIASDLNNDIISIGQLGDKIVNLNFEELKQKSEQELYEIVQNINF